MMNGWKHRQSLFTPARYPAWLRLSSPSGFHSSVERVQIRQRTSGWHVTAGGNDEVAVRLRPRQEFASLRRELLARGLEEDHGRIEVATGNSGDKSTV